MAKLFYDWVIMELPQSSQRPAHWLMLKSASGIEGPILKDLIDSSLYPSAQLWGFPEPQLLHLWDEWAEAGV